MNDADKISVTIDGQDYDCYPTTAEPEKAQEEPSSDPRLDWQGPKDFDREYLEISHCKTHPNMVFVETHGVPLQTAPQLYAAAWAFVRAGMALDGYLEEISTLQGNLEDIEYLRLAVKCLKGLNPGAKA